MSIVSIHPILHYDDRCGREIEEYFLETMMRKYPAPTIAASALSVVHAILEHAGVSDEWSAALYRNFVELHEYSDDEEC